MGRTGARSRVRFRESGVAEPATGGREYGGMERSGRRDIGIPETRGCLVAGLP